MNETVYFAQIYIKTKMIYINCLMENYRWYKKTLHL